VSQSKGAEVVYRVMAEDLEVFVAFGLDTWPVATRWVV
jgi:hypothetical protein